jgi:hypothetical protein
VAKDETRPLPAAKLREDIESYNAFKAFVDYRPANEEFSTANITALHDGVVSAQADEDQKYAAWQAAKDKRVTAQWKFHNGILGVVAQARAQWGDNSDNVQSLGRKKKVEYNKPSRNPKKKNGEGK